MGQKKLIRFEEIKTFRNVLQYPLDMQGKWNEFFKNNNPIILELGCGKGEYTIALSEKNPKINYLGIDQKGNRLWVGARKALAKELSNAAFLRIQIDHITEYFSRDEISEIWITFPDPQLRISKARKRLTHPKFLRLYSQFLKAAGIIHLKTDSPDLYNFTKTVINMYGCTLVHDIPSIYSERQISEELQIKTYYETLDIAGSKRIHYLCFSLPEILPGKEKDEELKHKLKELEIVKHI